MGLKLYEKDSKENFVAVAVGVALGITVGVFVPVGKGVGLAGLKGVNVASDDCKVVVGKFFVGSDNPDSLLHPVSTRRMRIAKTKENVVETARVFIVVSIICFVYSDISPRMKASVISRAMLS